MYRFMKSFAVPAATAVLAGGLELRRLDSSRAHRMPIGRTGPPVPTSASNQTRRRSTWVDAGAARSPTRNLVPGHGFFVLRAGRGQGGQRDRRGIDTTGVDTSGPLSGKIKSKSFAVSFHGKKCNVRFSGGLPSSDLVGGYRYDCDGKSSHGTFQFTFDSSGTTC